MQKGLLCRHLALVYPKAGLIACDGHDNIACIFSHLIEEESEYQGGEIA
jgi:hypothetical protein